MKTFVHPLTGITHTAIDTGWEPQVHSRQSSWNKAVWQTATVCIPRDEKERHLFRHQMRSQAIGLSQITGLKIEWHDMPDADANCFGDYGFFKVTRFTES